MSLFFALDGLTVITQIEWTLIGMGRAGQHLISWLTHEKWHLWKKIFFFSFFHDRKLWRKLLGTSRYRSTTFSFSIVLYCRWRPFLHLLPLSSESCCARKKELNADEGWDRIKRNDSFKYLHLLTRTRERQRKKKCNLSFMKDAKRMKETNLRNDNNSGIGEKEEVQAISEWMRSVVKMRHSLACAPSRNAFRCFWGLFEYEDKRATDATYEPNRKF